LDSFGEASFGISSFNRQKSEDFFAPIVEMLTDFANRSKNREDGEKSDWPPVTIFFPLTPLATIDRDIRKISPHAHLFSPLRPGVLPRPHIFPARSNSVTATSHQSGF
jgi:hypothetical protein